jgi:hypothetical protein
VLALLGALFGLLETIGLSLDGDDLDLVNEAIDQGDDAGDVGKDLTPLGVAGD